jgi:hypothetical protein
VNANLIDDLVLVAMMLLRLGVPILLMTLLAAILNRAARSLS